MTVSQTRFSPNRSEKLAVKRGLTLIEIMIALTMTLIVLGAMMSAFRFASEKMQMGRGVMEMANRLRSAEELLRNDLANLTLDPRPYTESTTPSGFVEIIEGVTNDSVYALDPERNYLGDIDDTIGMTVRSADGRKFRGTVSGAVIESTLAEVWYFTTVSDSESSGILVPSALDVVTGVTNLLDVDREDSVRLHRRALLIRPDLNDNGVLELVVGVPLTFATLAAVYDPVTGYDFANNDISVRVVLNSAGGFDVVANTLADLAVRKNRFAHTLAPFATNDGFPNLLNTAGTTGLVSMLKPNREDMLLSDVAGFDIRVYSPNATVHYSGVSTDTILVQPGDAGYDPDTASAGMTLNAGAFVDLGYGSPFTSVTATEWFSELANVSEPSFSGLAIRTYDTWTPLYEHDGIDQDNATDGGLWADQGTNGINDTVTGGTAAPDDDAERETRPPYPYPIRGIQISTRLFEKDTDQIHQSSIIQSYVPE